MYSEVFLCQGHFSGIMVPKSSNVPQCVPIAGMFFGNNGSKSPNVQKSVPMTGTFFGRVSVLISVIDARSLAVFPIKSTVRYQCLKCTEYLRGKILFIEIVFVIHKAINDLAARTIVV